MNIQKQILSCLFLIPSLSAFGQSSDENYVKTTEYLTEDGESGEKKITVMYYDGLGREKQLKQIGASPNETGAPGDLVTHFDYDGFGRPVKTYLPVPVASTTQEITAGVLSEYNGFYSSAPYMTDYYYSEKTIENSPLNRVMKQAAPGEDWAKDAGHEIEFEYKANTEAEQVIIFTVNPSTGALVKGKTINGTPKTYYPNGLLYKTTTTDENGNKIHEFKDKQGRVVLKRTTVANGSVAGRNTDPNPGIEPMGVVNSYYVYDIYGNLSYVIPPLASNQSVIGTTVLDNLCYQYKYDDRNRLVEKKLPGKGWEFIVYDKQDRLVATQDKVLRDDGGKWLFTKYDKFGRVLLTGSVAKPISRTDLQQEVNGWGDNNTLGNSSYTNSGLTIYYQQTSGFPGNAAHETFSVNYYDSYANLNFTAQLDGFEKQEVKDGSNGNLKGMATASFIRVLGTSTWEKIFNVYDLKSRLVGTYKTNHLGGFTKTESLLDFRGKPLETETIHKRTSNGTEVKVQDFFTYDGMERPTSHYQSIDNSVRNLIADTEYNRLGQLETKYVGGILGKMIDRWQEINYKYNIRGWLTDINSVGLVLMGKDQVPPGLGDDLFAFKIQYNQLVNGGSNVTDPLYNGNIAQTFWKTAEDNIMRGYHYTYDQMNRLRKADFYKQGNANITAYGEYLAYDLNGNIKHLVRSTGDATDNEIAMDDLAYTYQNGAGNSNRLMKVVENVTTGGGTGGFNNGTSGLNTDYTYDENGNMTSDLNKAITSITYNHLNLPTQVYWAADKKIDYLYNAAGQKVKKTVRDGNTQKVVDYLDGFQYAGGILQFFPHAEGYVKATQVSESPTSHQYAFNYVYNYTDHLGNVRLSFTKDPLTHELKIMEENHYYPFGLKHSVYSSSKKDYKEDPAGPGGTILTNVLTTSYQYKYNGKEYQDELALGMYDYGWRQYDPAISRWVVSDPLAEKMVIHSPYNYTYNNPVRFIDPNGMAPMTDYKLLHNGKVERVDSNDGSEKDSSDTLYATDSKGKVNKNKSVTVQKENASDSSIIGDLANNLTSSNNSEFSKGIRSGKTSNSDDAFSVYVFAAKNSKVEWGMGGFYKNGGYSFTIYTGHNEGFAPNIVDVAGNDLKYLEFKIHSHPKGDYVSDAQVYFPDTIDDYTSAAGTNNAHRNAGGRSTPKHYVLYAPMDGTPTMNLYKYWTGTDSKGNFGGDFRALGSVTTLSIDILNR